MGQSEEPVRSPRGARCGAVPTIWGHDPAGSTASRLADAVISQKTPRSHPLRWVAVEAEGYTLRKPTATETWRRGIMAAGLPHETVADVTVVSREDEETQSLE